MKGLSESGRNSTFASPKYPVLLLKWPICVFRQRRSSSGSQPHSNKGKMDVLMQRQRASRTVSAGSSDPPMARLRHGSGSTSPGRASGGQFSSCSQPNFGSRDSIPEQVGSGSIEISLADLFAQPGEILDSHKGVVTERYDRLVLFMLFMDHFRSTVF